MVRRRPITALVSLALAACSAIVLSACSTDSGSYTDYPPGDDGGDNLTSVNKDLGRSVHADLGHRPGADLAIPEGADLAMAAQPFVDMAMNQVPNTGVGLQGGSVELLHFGISGDTRPPNCEDTAGYPTAMRACLIMPRKASSIAKLVSSIRSPR